jgi:hypothetical protein
LSAREKHVETLDECALEKQGVYICGVTDFYAE